MKRFTSERFKNQKYKESQPFYIIFSYLSPSQICVYKAKGDLKTAALELHKILKISYGDASLWQELANIHEILGDYKVRYHLLNNIYIYFFVYITFW